MAKLPFNKIYGWLFSTFDPSSDTKLMKQMKEKGIKEAIVIKRSWIYGLFISWILIATSLLTVWNLFNMYQFFSSTGSSIWVGYGLMALMLYSLSSLLYSSVNFLVRFKNTYGKGNTIEPIEKVLKELEEGDVLFISFFNQITTNMFLFFSIILIYGFYLAEATFSTGNIGIGSIVYSVLDIGLLWGQIWLMSYYRKKMMDLEMDYNVVVPGMIYFVNQTKMLSGRQNLKPEKIKTVTEKAPGYIASFFKLGIVTVLTEGDQGAIGIMEMYFVENPTDTVANIYELVDKEGFKLKNKYLKNILGHLEIKDEDWELKETKIKVLEFIKTNNNYIKEDYRKSDIIGKVEIEEVYKKYWN